MTATKLITLSVLLLAGAAWLLLAVWGEGGFAIFFASPARTALIIVTFALMAAALSPKAISAPAKRRIAAIAGCCRCSW